MQKIVKYTIFKTKWGYFGLAAIDNGLLRTALPAASRNKVESQLLRYLPDCRFDRDLFRPVQQRIIAYFDGACADFRNIPVLLVGFGLFAKSVLKVCRRIAFGQTVTYGRLAAMANSPGAARAVGGALAQNPLPLIIPCHRVICAGGTIGGFSASGGVNLKKRLLKLESSCKATAARLS
jgi:methylated-DNA-[protein]-cysteine S-methyltransferase